MENERIKRAYFTYLAEAQRFSEPTLDAVAKLARLALRQYPRVTVQQDGA